MKTYWLNDVQFNFLTNMSELKSRDEFYRITEAVFKQSFEQTPIKQEDLLNALMRTSLPGFEIKNVMDAVFGSWSVIK